MHSHEFAKLRVPFGGSHNVVETLNPKPLDPKPSESRLGVPIMLFWGVRRAPPCLDLLKEVTRCRRIYHYCYPCGCKGLWFRVE